jgi:hypothetical protein
MAFTQILQLQEVVMEKGQQCKLGERESVTLLLWEISNFFPLCNLQGIVGFCNSAKFLTKEKTSSHGYLSQHLLHNENHNINQVNKMHEKKNT